MSETSYVDCLAAYGIGGAHPGSLALTKKIIAETEIGAHMSVLDAGCGTGQTAAYLHETTKAAITALDKHPIMINKAKKRLKHTDVHLAEGDVEKLPFHDGSFDLVLSESVLAFTDLETSLSEIRRVLKEDGILLAVEIVAEEELEQDEFDQLTAFYGFTYIPSEKQWLESLRGAGFGKVASETHPLEQLAEPDDLAEFMVSEHIDAELAKIMETHMQLAIVFQEKLGFRVFRCEA